MSLKPGDRLGDWVIERALGAGGMGSVYRCHSVLSTDVLAAVKVLTPSNLSDVEGRFVQEMRTLAGLNHPAIVRVLGGGRDEDRGLLYMAMELVDGEDLDARFRRGAMDATEMARVFGPVAAALAYAHDRGVAHRDIKPGNIMLRKDGTPVIVDFGIAVVSGQTRHTREGMVPGTLVYLPPELFEGEAPDPMSTDAYALGVVMWEAVTGRTAFEAGAVSSEGQQMAAVMGMKLRAEALDPGPQAAEGLREAVLRTTDPDPAERLVELDVVRELVAGNAETVELSPRRRTTRSRARRRRARWVMPAVAALFLLALVFGVGGVTLLTGAGLAGAWMLSSSEEPPARPPVSLDEALGRVASATAAGDLTEARVHAGRALDDHPEDPHANLAYGQILLAEGELLLSRPYLCAAVASGLGAKVPGHAEGQLDCERGPGASLPLTSPVALAQLDVSTALADLSALTAARQGDAVAGLDEDEDDAVAEQEELAPPRARRRPASTTRPSPAPGAPAPPARQAPAPPAPSAPPSPEPELVADEAPAPEISNEDIGGLASGGSSGYGGGSASGSGYGLASKKSAASYVVTQTDLEVTGSLSEDIVKRTLARIKNQIRACYEQAATRDPGLAGTVTYRLKIGADGKISAIMVVDSELSDALTRCSIGRLRRVTFPASSGPTTVKLTLDHRTD